MISDAPALRAHLKSKSHSNLFDFPFNQNFREFFTNICE